MIDPERLALAAEPLLGRCRLPPAATPVTCGVSGGADSLSLLALAVAAGCRATAVHVDHGLRPGSDREAAVVAEAAAALGASFRPVQVQVAEGPNLEARARVARHGALGPDALLGHTADDQAETVLGNLVRGAGLDGLAGIRADGRHPILALRRRETETLCEALGLRVVDDPSNRDPAFRRNRLRAEVLPLLDDITARDVAAVIARQAELVREAVDHLAGEAGTLDPTDGAALAAAPPAVARMAVRAWLRSCSAEGHPPDAATVERVLAVARLTARATEVGGGWRVARTGGRLRLEQSRSPEPSGTADPTPGSVD
ncbi:MAG TPA: tRNA lysidine(34) synthetase TilS [Acidimicrobiales bacterium]